MRALIVLVGVVVLGTATATRADPPAWNHHAKKWQHKLARERREWREQRAEDGVETREERRREGAAGHFGDLPDASPASATSYRNEPGRESVRQPSTATPRVVASGAENIGGPVPAGASVPAAADPVFAAEVDALFDEALKDDGERHAPWWHFW